MAHLINTIQTKIDEFVTRVVKNYPISTEEEERLMRRYLFLLLTAVPIGATAALVYLSLYLFSGITQALYATALLAFLFLYYLALHFLGRNGRFFLLGFLATAGIFILYAGLAFLFSNAATYLIIGGIALILLVGILLIPLRWYAWLPLAMLLVVAVFFAEQAVLLPRFDVRDALALRIFNPLVTASAGLIVLVEISRNLIAGNIQTRFLIIMTTAAVVPVAIVSLISGILTQRALTQAAEQSLLSAATQTATAVDTFMNTNLNLIASHAGLGDFRSYILLPPEERANSPEEERARRLLLQLARLDANYIASIALLDGDGVNVLDTILNDIGTNEATNPYFQEPLRNGQAYVSDFQYGSGPSGLAIYFSAPVRNTAGEPIGILRARYNAGVVQQIVYQNSGLLGEGSDPILVDEYLIRLADSGQKNLVLSPVAPLPENVLATLKANRRLPADATPDGDRELVAFAAGLRNFSDQPVFSAEVHPDAQSLDLVAVSPLSNKPWLIAFAQPQDLFLGPIQVQTRIAIASAFAVVVVVLLAATWLSRLFSRPIVALTEAVESVMAGNLETAVTATSRDEIGTLAHSFNAMTGQIRELVSTLEQRVQERTAALATSAEVGRRLATILDESELVRAVVQQVQEAFNYYHVHIYLFDSQKKELIMAGGTGEAGQIMLANRHAIAAGKGLVGRAAATQQANLVPDVQQEPGWLPNPLLPETKAEIAVPIAFGEEVLGVLDVQQNVVNGLNESDLDLLQSIAIQVAISLRNARLYENTQRQAEQEALLNEINQKILRTTDINSALQVAIRELGRAVDAPRVSVQFDTTLGGNGGHKANSD